MRKLIFISLCPWFAFAQVPEGFEELFEQEYADIKITVNDTGVIEIPGLIGLGAAELTIEEESETYLRKFLGRQYVKESAIEQIIDDLSNGVSDTVYCRGRRASCQLSEAALTVPQYVVVSERYAIRIFVPDSLMTAKQESARFIDDKAGDNALIMHHSLSAHSNFDASSDAYYQNETFVGVLGGYIHTDLNVTTTDENSRDETVYFDEAAFHYLQGAHHIKAGFTSENNPRVWNRTNILDAGEDISVYEVAVGTTQELEFRSSKYQPRIYFTVPQSGRLTVFREDGSPVLERNVSAGQHHISYDELPLGISTLKFIVRAGENVLYEEIHKIYNTADSNLEPGEWSYFVSIGALQDQEVIKNDEYKSRVEYYQSKTIVDTRVATQLNSDLTLGMALLNTPEDYFVKAALAYQPVNDFAIDAIYGEFEDESYYLQAGLSVFDLHVTSSQFSDSTNQPGRMDFANYLFGYGSTQELAASYGQTIGDGRAYISYSRFVRESVDSIIADSDKETFLRYDTLTAGYTFSSWYNSTIDLQASMSESEDEIGDITDSWSVGVNISLPLTTSAYSSLSATTTGDVQYYSASLGNSYELSENASVGLEVGTNQTTDIPSGDAESYHGSVSGYYDNEYISSNAFAYVDENSINVNANLSSSTIVTSDRIFQTREKAESYLVIENENNVGSASIDALQDEFLTIATLKGNDTYAGRVDIDEDEVIYPLDSYKEYQILVDDTASDFHNLGDTNVQASSYPGTTVNMDVDMREVRSYISVFNDIEGNPIDAIECRGRGCVSVEELTEGVFKFRISTGLPFELRTSQQRCLIPSPDTFYTQNLGHNFCMPTFEEDGELRITQGDSGHYYYYLGEFEDMAMIEDYENSISDTSLVFVKQKVGKRVFLFVESEILLASHQQQVIESLSQYALEETLERPMFVSR